MAAAAAAAAVTDTECSICHKLFTDPKLISCGHVLCRKCLLSWLSSQQDAPCPLCHRPIVDPETRQNQSVDDIVDSFPTDVTMKIWVKSEQLMQKDHVCQSCTTEAGSNLCLQCQDFLCASCTIMHGRVSGTRHHTVEGLSSLTAEKLAASHSTPCQVHTNEVCKLYCSSHQVSICMLCASSKHKNCPEVKGLEERAEETRAIFTELVATLTAQETKMDQAIEELDKLMQEMEKKAQAAADKINQTFDEIETAVKKRRQEALETTMDTFATAKKSIQDGKACLLQKRGALTTYRTAGERGKCMAASGEVGDMAVAMRKHVVDETSILLAADVPIINEATFVMDRAAVLSGVQKALAEVGQCKVAPAAVMAQASDLSGAQKALAEVGQYKTVPAADTAQFACVAAMAAAAAAGAVTDTECSICHELFTDPKLISCGHVLCRKCLLSWLSSQQDAPCPLCRRPIVDPETRQSQSVNDIVDSFPTDVTMKIWVKSEQLMQKDHVCQSCMTEAASNLCLQCQDFLCASCTTMHGRVSGSRHHTVEGLSSLTAEKLAASHSTPCQVHTNEVCKLYCSSHQVSICMLCASSKHKNCPEVKGLEERAEETRVILTQLVATLTAQETKMDQAIEELDKLLQEMEKKAQAAADEINQTFDEIEAAVKKRRQEALETTMDTFATAKKSIQDGKACLLQKRGALTTYRAAGERGKRMAASGEVGDMAVAMRKHVVDDTSTLLAADAPIINEATFVMDTVAVLSGVQKALAEVGQCNCKVAPAAVMAQPQAAVLRFHDNCGENITLSNHGKTAERKGSDNFEGIVVSSQPMVPHRLYEVHLDERDALNGCYMWVGAATVDPGRLTLPASAHGWTSAVVFYNNCVKDHGKQINIAVGKKLVDLPKGSHVGVKIDDSRRLHLYIDGQNQGHADIQVSQPCYAFFDVWGPYRKVTAQPVKIVK